MVTILGFELSWVAIIVSVVIILIVTFIFRPNPLVDDLAGKYVFITGCDTGFGNKLAHKLDKYGVNVFAACLTEKGEASLRESCSERLITLRLDVTKPEQIAEAYKFVKKHLPRDKGLWGVVNNAGIALSGFFDWTPISTLQKTFDVNVWGVVITTKTFLPLIKKSQGRIVNVASALGRVAFPGNASYCMSKFAVRSFSDSLRLELSVWNVSVHAIEPGFFKTNITDGKKTARDLKAVWDGLDDSVQEEYGITYFENVSERLQENLKKISSSDTDKVVDAMFHALLASRPKVHYPVGWDMLLFYRWFAMLPACITDKLFQSKTRGLKPAKAP